MLRYSRIARVTYYNSFKEVWMKLGSWDKDFPNMSRIFIEILTLNFNQDFEDEVCLV